MLTTALPAESDDFGDGSVQVYALSIGEDAFNAIMTAIIERPADFTDEGPLRVSYLIDWTFVDGSWLAQSTLTAFVLGEEFLTPEGEGAIFYPNWERYEG